MTSRIFYIFILFCVPILQIHAKTPDKYPTSLIHPGLTENADVIIRIKNTDVEFHNNAEIEIHETIAITLLNDDSKEAGAFYIPYDAFSSISDITGDIYDSDGKFIRILKKEDINDFSAGSRSSIFQDDRVKRIRVLRKSFPFTVEFSYTKKISEYFTPPKWHPVFEPRTSLENAKLKITAPENILVYKDFISGLCQRINKDKKSIYNWEINNFKAVKHEENIPNSYLTYPFVLFHTGEYHLKSIKGNISTWSDIGNFYYNLNEGSDLLNPEAQKEIISLTENSSDTQSKVKLLYNWMQLQSRYVSIQQGIGGWKSYDADFVYKNKFGDCKALVNFMKATLLAAGIKSYPVLIGAGEHTEYVNTDFPFNYFNHVVLSVPINKDTTWLECTSQHQPFGYLGSFTSDRNGLLIDYDKSHLIHTPLYGKKENKSLLIATINISSDSPTKCIINQKSFGELQEEIRDFQYSASTKEKDDWIHYKLLVSDFKLSNYKFIGSEKDSAYSELEIALESNSMCVVSGNRLFIHANVLKDIIEDFPVTDKRSFPIESSHEANLIDSIVIHLPEHFVPESGDRNEKIESELGSFEYKLKYNAESHSFILLCTYTQVKKIISADKYPNCLEFKNKIITLKNKPIVCIRQ